MTPQQLQQKQQEVERLNLLMKQLIDDQNQFAVLSQYLQEKTTSSLAVRLNLPTGQKLYIEVVFNDGTVFTYASESESQAMLDAIVQAGLLHASNVVSASVDEVLQLLSQLNP